MSTPINPPDRLALLSSVLRDVCRVRRLAPEDAQDFAQSVHLKMLERDYEAFRRFSGRSSLRTYLTVVVTRLLLDWRNSTAGKWRPSAVAVRLGERAVTLERLVHRDHYSLDEAIEIMRNDDPASSPVALRLIAERLPPRTHRRTVSADALRNVSSAFEDPLEAVEKEQTRRHIEAALARAIDQLPPEEQRLIRLRYEHQQSVQLLAQSLRVDARKLYGRFDRTLRSLRKTLAAAGVTAPAAISAADQPPKRGNLRRSSVSDARPAVRPDP